ncbi:MAG: cell surface protein SprA [Candidatus Kapaibacterium sp.]
MTSSRSVIACVFVCSVWIAVASAPIARAQTMRRDDSLRSSLNTPLPTVQFDAFASSFATKRLGLPSGLEIMRTLDSSASKVRISGKIQGIEVGVPLELTLDDYLAQRQKQISRKVWDSLITVYDLKRALSGDQLSKLLSQATNIAIPLPPNPLSSIFGKPEISINVNGEITLRGGWRWERQNLGNSSAFGQGQSSPIFTQDIQINVSGRIGDKLRLGTDWSTRRQFEFDNRFRIGYDGYDDDIIKKVELGNVQLPSQSTFISGSQALFGVRADFQFGPLYLKTIASQRRGERRIVNVNGGAARTRFALRAYDYAPNHFFLDTAYKPLYRSYWALATPVTPQAGALLVKDVEVYESTGDIKEQALGGVNVVAYDTLSPVQYELGQRYPATLKTAAVIEAGKVMRGRFVKLDRSRYEWDQNLGKVSINNMRRDRTYATAYRTQGPTSDAKDDFYTGTISTSSNNNDTLILKLLYVPNLQPGFKNLWARQLRNIYFINATNVNTGDARINVFYLRTNNDSTDVLEGTSDKIVTALRVDQVNNGTGTPPGDGVFDFSTGMNQPQAPQMQQQQSGFPQQSQSFSGSPFFNAQRGEITFPSLEPFREGLDTAFARRGQINTAKQYYFAAVYDNQVELARQQTAFDRWLITGEVQGQMAGRVTLGFNVAPGSVRVRLDGRELRENDDYTVEYVSGMLTIRNPQAAAAGANLSVEYESNDIMNVTTKTLAGIRADMSMYRSRNLTATMGGTYMYYNQAAIIDRVRVGEEPVANEMVGLDFAVQWKADWLTRALNALPFFDTKEQSLINLKGEWAMQMPTPNKRISDVPADNGGAVAYIDDFESAQRNIPLGLSATQWTHASPPVDSSIDFNAKDRGLYRGKAQWWQYFIGRIAIADVYPKRQTVAGRSNISPLFINFMPDVRGIYNENKEFIDSLNPRWDSVSSNPWSAQPSNRSRIWGGFQRLLSSFNSNFDLDNIDYVEVMMRVEDREEGTKMYLDLGQVSEDVISNSTLNTEDGITSTAPIPNNRIDPGEDVGLDQRDNAQEKSALPYPLNLEDDPSRDDYNFDFSKDDNLRSSDDFRKFNNHEGNSTQSEIGQFPDTEVLNKQNGQNISLDDSYFSYEINLDPGESNTQIVGGGNNGWRLYRIPLRGNKRVVGNPLFSNIQYLRVWFKGGRLKAQIADWRFAGAQWQRVNYAAVQNSANAVDNTLRVSFVNREENDGPPDYYTMPPGVQAPRNLANPDPQNDIRLNEQSIAIGVDNLSCGDERAATRYFRTFDMFFYRNLKFFVKGIGGQDYIPPDSLSLTEADTNAPQFYIRFGTDSANYYEYRSPLVREWKGISIDLQNLTAIKQKRDSIDQYRRMSFRVPGENFARYAIQGNPTLTRTQFIALGIANPPGRCPTTLSTTMWVDELRLLNPESDNGMAVTGSFDMKLADLGTISASYISTDSYFHRLEERFGTREDQRSFNFTADATLEKFLPSSMKEARIPIHFARTTRSIDPRFVAQNDVNVEKAAALAFQAAADSGASIAQANAAADYVRSRAQTRREQTNFSIVGFKFGLPSQFWLIRETLNKLVLGFSYTQEAEQSPVVRERFRWQWDASANYALSLPPIATIKTGGWMEGLPLLNAYKDWKINFLPQSITLSSKVTRMRRTEQSWFLNFPTPPERLFSATNSMAMQWKLTEGGLISPALDYSANSGSTLVPLELDSLGRQLPARQVAERVLLNDGRLIDFGTPNTFTQNFALNFRPRLPDIANINKFFDASGSFTTNYMWVDPLQSDPLLRDISKRASYTNTIRVNTTLRLRQLTNTWFGIAPTNPNAKLDTSASSGSIVGGILDGIRSAFFDYESLNINFNQSNSSIMPGVMGSNGFSNLWGRTFTGRESELLLGPSGPFQLGLVRYPHSGIRLRSSSAFPYFGFDEVIGPRAPNAQLQDNYMQMSNLEMRTSRPLWKGATLDLSWRTEFGNNLNQLTTTDAQGIMSFNNVIMSERYSRTFLTFPNFLMFAVFNNTPENVVERYNQSKDAILNGRSEDSLSIGEKILLQNAMTNSFIGGLQAFEFLPGVLARYLPQVNWSLRWEGIEKLIFVGSAQRITFEHTYQSTYTEGARRDDNGRVVDAQTVQMAFQPLVGMTMTFDEKKVKGTLTSSLRYNMRTNYALAAAARTLSQENQHEFQMSASYAVRGFAFPILGIDLQNDVEFSFNATYRRSNRATFALSRQDTSQAQGGSELDGSTMIMIEPRARYTVSNRLTATAFLKYTGNFTSGAANPGFSTTEAGVEVRLAISGGR